LVLDQFLGSGTTLIEAKLLNRDAIGVDINDLSISISKTNLDFNYDTTSKIFIRKGNAKKLNFIRSESIDLICTHPPYANVIKYSNNTEDDISLMCYDDFINSMNLVAFESYRVLKKGKACAIMIGDIRKNGKVVPLGFEIMSCFLNKGFKSKEIIIKEQHNCRSTEYWSKRQNNFLMLAHEYVFVFEK